MDENMTRVTFQLKNSSSTYEEQIKEIKSYLATYQMLGSKYDTFKITIANDSRPTLFWLIDSIEKANRIKTDLNNVLDVKLWSTVKKTYTDHLGRMVMKVYECQI